MAKSAIFEIILFGKYVFQNASTYVCCRCYSDDTSKKFLHVALVGYNFLKRYKHFYLTNHVINSQYFEFSNFSQRKPIQWQNCKECHTE